MQISQSDAALLIEVLDLEMQKFRDRLDARRLSKADAKMCNDRIAELYDVKRRLELQQPIEIQETSATAHVEFFNS